MTGLERLARDVERAIPKVLQAANGAAQKTGRDGLKFAMYFSGGTVPARLMRIPVSAGGLGHPYSVANPNSLGVRGPMPYGTPDIINSQSGKFQADWRLYLKAVSIKYPGLQTWAIENTAPYASFLEHGTRTMVARPIGKLLQQYVDAAYVKNVYDALKPILTKAFEGA
jgi:hypothetical protein